MKTNVFLLTALIALVVSGCQNVNKKNLNANRKGTAIQPHFNTPIAQESKNGKTYTLFHPDVIRQKWENTINRNSDLDLSFNKINIYSKDGQYFLRAKDDADQATSVIQLVLDGKFLYEYNITGEVTDKADGGRTITCSGCTSAGKSSADESIPEYDGDHGWYCTDCQAGDGFKTVTITSPQGIVSEE